MLKQEAARPYSTMAPSVPAAEASCCRFCNAPLEQVFIDLGLSPLANSYLKNEDLKSEEQFFPLRAYVCGECFLVQLEEWETPENIFGDYAYFSSYSESWLQHAKAYVRRVVDRFGIGSQSKVVEIASNDGYLLQYFAEREIPVLGIEPVSRDALGHGLATYLRNDPEPLLFADWPEDIAHAAMMLVAGPGRRYPIDRIRFELCDALGFDGAALSAVPHNPLHDAAALRTFILARELRQ